MISCPVNKEEYYSVKKRINFFHIFLFSTMSLAFLFGFLDLWFFYNFERLHIFLFNLTSGGFIILYLTESKKLPSRRTYLFFFLSIIYALSAFFELYTFAIFISLLLAIIVEKYRHENFSTIPVEFFKSECPPSKKFHHGALLCLELALIFSIPVILNDVYFHFIKLEKLKLNMFFLGFSFPVSLITFSLIFKIIEKKSQHISKMFNHILFWSITLGVGIFFFLIIFKIYAGEIIAGIFLFTSVVFIFTIFFRDGIKVQQKHLLVSGMFFLLISAFTGILYILTTSIYPLEEYGKAIMRVHAFFSLYGWNLTGMLVIIRWNDFPLQLDTSKAIYAHWFIITLAPIAKFYSIVAFIVIPCYILYLYYFFFAQNKIRNSVKFLP